MRFPRAGKTTDHDQLECSHVCLLWINQNHSITIKTL
jgi:hypothetical protein